MQDVPIHESPPATVILMFAEPLQVKISEAVERAASAGKKNKYMKIVIAGIIMQPLRQLRESYVRSRTLHRREGEEDQYEPIMKLHRDEMEPILRSTILHLYIVTDGQ